MLKIFSRIWKCIELLKKAFVNKDTTEFFTSSFSRNLQSKIFLKVKNKIKIKSNKYKIK